MKACLAGIRFALPEATLGNDQLAAEFGAWSAAKILAKTGICSRRIAAPEECASDLAVRAAQSLLASESIDPSSVEFLLYCTQTPDYILPSTACILQHRLGLSLSCGALDYNLGCSGYIYGLGLAQALIESGQARSVLLLTADTYSKLINPADKSVRTLFGDGASATWLTAGGDDTSIGPFVYGTDGAGAGNLIVPTGGMRRPVVFEADLQSDENGNSRTVNNLFMDGTKIFDFTIRMVPEVVKQLLAKAGIGQEAVDIFVFHQANRFILDHLRRKLQIPEEKFVIAMEQVGNTVSSSIPIALRQAHENGQLVKGALVMLVGFGVGYSWGATLVRWGIPAGE